MTTYPWQHACLKAILETDNSLIYSRIAAARSILMDRLDAPKPIGEEEKAEIENAFTGLEILESERCPESSSRSSFQCLDSSPLDSGDLH
jgi:hypothetical protein